MTEGDFVSCMEEPDGERLKVLPGSAWLVVGYDWLKFIGIKRMALVGENSN